MSEYLTTERACLRADPDDASDAIGAFESGVHVAVLQKLGSWAKASSNGSIGWMHSNQLTEIKPTEIKLANEPGGQSRQVTGEIIAVKVQLPGWNKVRVRLDDGSVAEGWVETGAILGPKGNGANGAADPDGQLDAAGGADSAGHLSLGVNEIYRAPLLKAESRTEIDAAALAALIDAEANKKSNGQWDANSKARDTSASGLTQFLDTTWQAEARKNGTYLNQTCKDKGYVTGANVIVDGKLQAVLDLRFNPELSIMAAAEYGASNLAGLVQDGVVEEEIGDDEKPRIIYIAHHEGLAGAKGYLKGTKAYSFSNLVLQAGQAKAIALTDAAGGDTTKAYHAWLEGYIDDRIQPSRYRSGATGASGASPNSGISGATDLSSFTGAPVLLSELSARKELAKAIQWRLSQLGFLDPPADGFFGPVSIWALREFCEMNGMTLATSFTKEMAQRLLSPTATLPAIAATGTWFDKVVKYMTSQSYFIARHPQCKNIVYLEGANADGTINDDLPNKFNDLRIVFSIDKTGVPVFEDSIWEGTTEPGTFWTMHPMNPKGAARIAFNQYKAWAVGVHHAGRASAHEALVQVKPVTVFRDLNKDYKRPGDRMDSGLFGINQHWGYDQPVGDLGRSSAGCLVGRTTKGHRQFMALIKDDPRYKVNRGYQFMTAIMPGDQVLT